MKQNILIVEDHELTRFGLKTTFEGVDFVENIYEADSAETAIKVFNENKVDVINKNLDNAMNNLEEKMKTTKNVPFDKKHVLVEKDTFDSMNKVIKETKRAIEFQPKIQELFNEVDTFTKSHQTLEKENQNMKREIKALTTRNQNLTKENNNLKDYLKSILEAIKQFFRELLQIGNEKTKELTTNEIKEYYDNKDFDSNDVYDISKGTTKEDELFDYAGVPSYLKANKKSYDDKEKDDFEMSL